MSKIGKRLGLVLITNVLVLVAAGMLAPIYAVYVEKVGGDILDVGIAAALFALAAGLTSLLAGKYSDKIRHKQILVAICYFLTGVGFLGYIFVQNIWQLFTLQAFIGLVQAGYEPAFDGMYTKYLGNAEQASSKWGLWEAGNYFSIAGGAFLGALIVTWFGFNWLFVGMAALCFISALILVFKKRSLN
ncbi:MAG TPA: MFS transporter [Candidatus Saccharimonadales bacterium]|nr:MFS transporter [Candidatus Saccharimonadales bacterium]